MPPAPASPRVGLASRRAAWRAIRTVHERRAWSPPAVGAALRATTLGDQDRAFAANLAYSTLRWEGTLDWALAQVVQRPLADIEPAVLDVLRIGAWQLLYGNVPDRAAVDTAVEVARTEVGDRVTGFVNGVLRGLGRTASTLPWPSGDAGVGLRLAYPAWMVAEARRRFGARAEDVLAAGNVSPGLTLRATGDRDLLVAELQAAGLDAHPGRRAPEAVRVAGGDPNTLPSVAAGRATPQDEASMLVARVVVDAGGARDAPPAPGWCVLDLCAAPGGKSTHLAQLGAAVVAADLRPTRAGLVAAAATRLGLADRIAVVVADATAPPWRRECFDAVLVDAPCTGLGVVRRRPELRWRRDADDPARLGRLQLQLLESASTLVRPGGRLVYSVCTWPVAETSAVANAFLAAHGDRFAPVDVAATLGADPVAGDPGVQLAPDVDEVDGMYVAAFGRT
ncbi:MAG: transcription antitermination factor NusB [Egibacteraceae bacterium]